MNSLLRNLTSFMNFMMSLQIKSLRIMLLGMVNDPRVVLIKLADRLHNMRTMYAFFILYSHIY